MNSGATGSYQTSIILVILFEVKLRNQLRNDLAHQLRWSGKCARFSFFNPCIMPSHKLVKDHIAHNFLNHEPDILV